jgi:hypothetical protein
MYGAMARGMVLGVPHTLMVKKSPLLSIFLREESMFKGDIP